MRAIQSFEGVFLHRAPIDMRKSLDGLAAIVTHEIRQPLDGRFLFAFSGRRRDRVKLLWWDKTGLALTYKRLERDRFPWPKAGDLVYTLSTLDLEWLLDGVDLAKVKRHRPAKFADGW